MNDGGTPPENWGGGGTRQHSGRRVPFRLLVLPVIAVGGVIGALGRDGIAQALPARGTELPWATFIVNAAGCLLIGVLMAAIEELPGVHGMVRPFLGVGVLGGFTTFSTYAVETHRLAEEGAGELALLYFFGTLAAALAAVVAGIVAARLVIRAIRKGRNGE